MFVDAFLETSRRFPDVEGVALSTWYFVYASFGGRCLVVVGFVEDASDGCGCL